MQFAKTPIFLPSEDRIRMTRLYEEVFIRLEEMAMITARILKLEAGAEFSVRFNPLPELKEHEFAAVEVVSTAGCSGCYDYRAGACFGTETRQEPRSI